MNEENEKKKEFLRGYRKSLKREESICDDIQELRARKMFPSCGSGDGMPHGSNLDNLSDYIVILDEMLENLKKERYRWRSQTKSASRRAFYGRCVMRTSRKC